MKICLSILALSAFHPNVWGTSAFTVQTPKAGSTALFSSFDRGSAVSEGTATSGPQISDNGGLTNADRGTAGGRSFENSSFSQKSSLTDVDSVTVQGGSLRTWSFTTPAVERVQVLLKTEGRPLNANVDLWQGPDNTPQKMGVYIEDGNLRPFCAVIETPRGQNSIAIRNTGQMEFPLSASVEADVETPDGRGSAGLGEIVSSLAQMTMGETIQGGSLKTYSFAPSVESVQILLKTDGRPLNARVELLQGPNNNKQVVELYTEDGLERPFFAVIETPGVGNVVRLLNTAPVEFPLNARVEPYLVGSGGDGPVVVSDGGTGWGSRGL